MTSMQDLYLSKSSTKFKYISWLLKLHLRSKFDLFWCYISSQFWNRSLAFNIIWHRTQIWTHTLCNWNTHLEFRLPSFYLSFSVQTKRSKYWSKDLDLKEGFSHLKDLWCPFWGGSSLSALQLWSGLHQAEQEHEILQDFPIWKLTAQNQTDENLLFPFVVTWWQRETRSSPLPWLRSLSLLRLVSTFSVRDREESSKDWISITQMVILARRHFDLHIPLVVFSCV